MKRTLRLRKETLGELGADELRSVVGAGGTHVTCYTGLTYCGICGVVVERPDIPSIDTPCQTT